MSIIGQPSDQAVTYANSVASICQQIRNLQGQIQNLLTVNTNDPLGTKWNALQTTALTADGQFGTADGTPNTAHNIDGRVYANLGRSASATAYGQALQVIVDFNTFVTGGALSANSARPAQIDAVAT
jgi:hypothetical protein